MSSQIDVYFPGTSSRQQFSASASQGPNTPENRILTWKKNSQQHIDPFQSSVDDENFLKRQKQRLYENPTLIKINDARRTSQHKISFLRRAFIIFSTSACFTILLTVFMIIPLSKMVMGFVFYYECPVEPMIPLYLLVGGGVACLRDIINICLRSSLSDESYIKYEIPISAVAFIYTAAEITWFVYGSIFVFKTLTRYQGLDKTDANYCNLVLYMYAFVVTTLSYFLLWMTFFVSCATLYLARCLDIEKDQDAVVVVQIV